MFKEELNKNLISSLLIVFFLLTSPFVLIAQQNNIEKIDANWTFMPFYTQEYSYLSINNREGKAEALNYHPNIMGSIGAHLSYKFIGLSLSFKLPKSSEYNPTKMTRFVIDITGNRIRFNIGFVHYKGMYLSNYKDFNNTGFSYPNMTITRLFWGSQFIFSKRFSYKAAFKQTERQKKSAGSFLLRFGDVFHILSNDSSFIIASQQAYYKTSKDINNMVSNTFNIAPGYAYTLVISPYFSMSSILAGGLGLHIQSYSIDNHPHIALRLPWYFYNQTVIGYNSDSFFCRISYTIESNTIRLPDANFNIFNNYFLLSAGYRW